MRKSCVQSMMTVAVGLSIAAALSGCNQGKGQAETNTAEDACVQDEAPVCSPLNAQTAAALIANINEETAADCGFELIYQEETEGEFIGESGEFSSFTYVYGFEVEKGDKLEYGYELKPVGDHACWYRYVQDTSRQGTFYFKQKADAESFFNDMIDYGLVIKNDTYLLPSEKLPDGSVEVENLIDYNILAQITPPHLDEFSDYYRVEISYYS